MKNLTELTQEHSEEIARICGRDCGKDIVRNMHKEMGLKYHITPYQMMQVVLFLQYHSYKLPPLEGYPTLPEVKLFYCAHNERVFGRCTVQCPPCGSE